MLDRLETAGIENELRDGRVEGKFTPAELTAQFDALGELIEAALATYLGVARPVAPQGNAPAPLPMPSAPAVPVAGPETPPSTA